MMKQRNGSHLKALREKTGLSARDLGEHLGVPHSNVLFWENSGTLPRSSILLPMAQALGVSIEELLGEARPHRVTQPGGKLGRVFQEVSTLSRRQQDRIIAVVEDMLVARRAKS